jgi:phosphoribosylamine--glycine ligase
MRVLFVEKNADGLLDLAIRAWEAGHEVRYHLVTYDQHKNPVGRGLVEREHDWRRGIRWADLTIVGGNDYCQLEFDRWRRDGALVVGSCVEAETWESDRAKGMAVFKKAKIEVPAYRTFNNYDAAIAYVKKQDRPFVSKPSGQCDDKAMSYVGKSPADLVYMLERWKRAGKRLGEEFILQEKISGVEFAVGAWFGPDGFVREFEENFEHKRLFPGNLGPNTGELGTCSRFVRRSKLAEKVLLPLEPMLERVGFVGCVDVSVIVDDEGTPWPLEFTTRGGWPALNLECSAFDCDFIEFFAGLAQGRPPRKVHKLDEIVIGIVLALPDFPYSHATRKEVVGVPMYGLTPQLQQHVHFCQAMMGEAPQQDGADIRTSPCIVSAGDYVAVITGSGSTVQGARRNAYNRIKALSMPASPFHRIDIGSRLAKDLPELQKHGYAVNMSYA